MSDEINYANNPLHGVSLTTVLTDLVDHYGFEILNAYLSINCFKTKPTIESSEKFLKKTDWAREKVEIFYLYEYKNLPRVSSEQFLLPPRDRIVADHQKPGLPKELSLEDAERLQQKRDKKTAEHKSNYGKSGSNRISGESRYGSSASGGHGNSYSSGFGAPKPKGSSDISQADTSQLNPKEAPSGETVDPWAKSRK
jgi:uncharacterized protein (DUF2132 family)